MKRAVQVVQLLAVIGAVVFVVALFANEPSGGGGDAGPAGGDADAAAVFQSRCAACHGARGQGLSAPKLADGAVVERFPDVADQAEVVRQGRPGMPAFEGVLTDEEIEAVVEYTRSL